jgi:hypothetical protein
MNIIFDIEDIEHHNFHFLEKKKNVVLDGYFTKIIYSNEYLTMNGIFFKFPVQIQSINEFPNKNIIHYYSYAPTNLAYIEKISEMENNIIHYYKSTYNINKKVDMGLTNQLLSGSFKIYKEPKKSMKHAKYVLKISGIWETRESVGVTFKFMVLYDS